MNGVNAALLELAAAGGAAVAGVGLQARQLDHCGRRLRLSLSKLKIVYERAN